MILYWSAYHLFQSSMRHKVNRFYHNRHLLHLPYSYFYFNYCLYSVQCLQFCKSAPVWMSLPDSSRYTLTLLPLFQPSFIEWTAIDQYWHFQQVGPGFVPQYCGFLFAYSFF